MKKTASNSAKLTLGPLFFHWPAEKRRDFYYRMADEADIDCVYLGEVVCSKREPFFAPHFSKVIDRLQKAKKEIVLSTLALVTSEREMKTIAERAKQGFMLEANDVACLKALEGSPHVIGPFINVFNESARNFLARNNATRIVLPVEMPFKSIKILAKNSKAETEALVFGRQPLSVAMRCYHARSQGLTKDSCRFACQKDPDGMLVETMDGQPILAVSGSQTLSHGYVVLLKELKAMRQAGVTHFRLSPQNADMVQIAALYRSVLKKPEAASGALAKLKKMTGPVQYINGFFYGKEGLALVKED